MIPVGIYSHSSTHMKYCRVGIYMTHVEYCINYCIIAVDIVEEVSGLLPAFHSAVPSFPWLQAYT